jgi:hypothetical protein
MYWTFRAAYDGAADEASKNDCRLGLPRISVQNVPQFFGTRLIVGSLSGSRLKSVRFLVEESGELMTSDELMKIIKINH